MENLWIYLPFLAPVVVAQFGERQRWARYVTYGLLISINLGLLAFVALALLNQLAKNVAPQTLNPVAMRANWTAVAIACLLTSMVAFVPLIPRVRQWLARRMPIDPSSMVHMTALTFAVYQIGLNLGQMALIGDLENLITDDLVLTIWDVILSGVPMVLFALVGVGLFIRRDAGNALDRLGLHRPTWKHLVLAMGTIVLLTGINYGINLMWEALDPDSYNLLNEVTEHLFGNLTTIAGALVLGLSAGISEELLFRGAVQPRLGILLATVLFAVGHLQYGLTVAMLQIFAIGLILGLVRKWTNTTTSIIIHAGYNMLIVLFGLIQP
jgi:membrane protease YdiL (CAAX protease family)